MPYRSSRTRERMTDTTRAAHPFGVRREEQFPVRPGDGEINPRDGDLVDQTDESLLGFGTLGTMTT